MIAWSVLWAGLAVTLMLPGRARVPAPREVEAPAAADDGWLLRRRPLWCALAAFGAATFVGGAVGLLVAPVVGVGCWVLIGRAEPPAVRRTRSLVRRDLPRVVTLLAAALRSGAAPDQAFAVVADALPGPAADRLSTVAARLALGADPRQVWAGLGADPELALLGRALGRAHETGASVVAAVERLADDLSRRARGDVEDRARAVGVKAALPLGLCLLPSFLLLGIVPLVVGLLSTIQW